MDNKLAPRVNASTFYARSEVPAAEAGSASRLWNKIKSFFNGCPEHDERYRDLRGLMDLDKMIASFKAASFIDEHGEEREEDPVLPQQEHQQEEHHPTRATTARATTARATAARATAKSIRSNINETLFHQHQHPYQHPHQHLYQQYFQQDQ